MRRAGDLLETLGDFDAVGVSTAGQVRDGVICYANDNLPGYTGTDVRGVLGGRFGGPCAVINDAYAAAVGEGSDGAAKGFADYLCLTYGTGVGGGVVLGGRPYTGSGGSAATALGALVTHPEAICAGDPYASTYERCASATALVEKDTSLIQNAHGSLVPVCSVCFVHTLEVLRGLHRPVACGGCLQNHNVGNTL